MAAAAVVAAATLSLEQWMNIRNRYSDLPSESRLYLKVSSGEALHDHLVVVHILLKQR